MRHLFPQDLKFEYFRVTWPDNLIPLNETCLAAQDYKITVNGIKDLAAAANTILPDTRVLLSHEDAPANMVAWYQMNDMPIVGSDTILYDNSGNANDGLVHNDPVVGEGFLGNAVEFDYSKKQFVQFQNSASFDIAGSAVSISVWTKLTYLPVEMPVSYGPLFDSQGDEYVIYADKWNKELRFKVVTSATAERPGIPNDDLITGQWIHVMAVYDGTSAKIYLNGVLKDEHAITGTVKTGTVPMLAKSGTAGTPAFFNGSIDNVQVFAASFTAEEVVEMYNNYKKSAELYCEPYETTVDVTICAGETYTFPDGTTGTETGSHASVFTNIFGCDSIINTNLTVHQVNVEVTLTDGTLTASSTEGTFKWLDCDNGNSVIEGATSASFTPEVTGNYAVEVTEGTCTEISSCEYVEVVGIYEKMMNGLRVYPNPGNGIFMVDLTIFEAGQVGVEVFDITGQRLHSEQLNTGSSQVLNISHLSQGMYLLKVSDRSGTYEKTIVIQ